MLAMIGIVDCTFPFTFVVAPKCVVSFEREFRAKQGLSTRAQESFRMASGRIFRMRLNFLSYSFRRLRPHRHVLLSQKLWPPSRWSCKAYKLYGSAGLSLVPRAQAGLCLPVKSMFTQPKTSRPSLASHRCG